MEQRPIQDSRGAETPGIERNGAGHPRVKAHRRALMAGETPDARDNQRAQGTPGDPAFHVLLERLSRSARELQENADAVERPQDLAGAVGRAKASLDDALSLGEELLEAWRAKQLNQNPEKSDR
jgi:hypothetical protein